MKRRLGPQDYVDMPWKNGGGTTRELLKLPAPDGGEGFLARLSIATVAESGPFSRFPGIDRTILVLDGEGMALSVDGGPERVLDKVLQPFEFAGDVHTDCRLLGGAIRDFNLMVERRHARAALRVLSWRFPEPQALEPADDWLFYVLAGSLEVAGETLAAEECLWLSAEAAPVLRGDGETLVIAIALTRRP
ncbi:MAG: HutD family protein [Gammaproteobacteria bacterium]|nr:HutD family protein [Gammaproteobacteria bacterium]